MSEWDQFELVSPPAALDTNNFELVESPTFEVVAEPEAQPRTAPARPAGRDNLLKFAVGRVLNFRQGKNQLGSQAAGLAVGAASAADAISGVEGTDGPVSTGLVSQLPFPISLMAIKPVRDAIKAGGRKLREELDKEAQLLESGVQSLDEGKAGKLASKVVPTAVASAPAVPLAMVGGLPLAALGAGSQSFGSTLNEASKAYRKDKNLTEQEADEKALFPAGAAGASTALVTFAFGKTGIESLAKFASTPARKVISSVGSSAIVRAAKGAIKGFFTEATEEGTDQVVQTIIQKASYNPKLTFPEAVSQVIEAAAIGGLLGGVVGGGVGALSRSRKTEQPTVVEPPVVEQPTQDDIPQQPVAPAPTEPVATKTAAKVSAPVIAPPSQPAPAAQPQAAPVAPAKKVKADPIQDYVTGVNAGTIRRTEDALAFGATLKTKAQIDRIVKAREEARVSLKAAIQAFSENETPETGEAISRLSIAPQMFAEALEAATGAIAVKQTNVEEYNARMAALQPVPAAERIRQEIVNSVGMRDAYDAMRELTGVDRSIDGDYPDVQAHGTPTLSSLESILRKFDPARQFFTGALTKARSGTGMDVRSHSSFVVVGKPGQMIKQRSDIAGVLVDQLYAPEIPKLRKLFPGVRFVAASEASKLLGKKAAAPAATTTPAAPAPVANEIDQLETLEEIGALTPQQEARLNELRNPKPANQPSAPTSQPQAPAPVVTAPPVVAAPAPVAPAASVQTAAAPAVANPFASLTGKDVRGFITERDKGKRTYSVRANVATSEDLQGLETVASGLSKDDATRMAGKGNDIVRTARGKNQPPFPAAAATPPVAPVPPAPKPKKAKKAKEVPAEPPRQIDTTKGNTFGPAFDDKIGRIPGVGEGLAPWFSRILKGARIDDKSPKKNTRRTLILRDTESGQLVEVGIYDNNGAKIVHPETGKGKDAAEVLRTTKQDGTNKYDVIATVRYADARPDFRRTLTQDDVVGLLNEFTASNTGITEVSDDTVNVDSDTGEVSDAKGVRVVTAEEAKKGAIVTDKSKPPVPSPNEAVELLRLIGQPKWKNKNGGIEIVNKALFGGESGSVATFVARFMQWVRVADKSTVEEADKLVERIYESIENAKDEVKEGTLKPGDFNAQVLSSISGKDSGVAGQAVATGDTGTGQPAPASNVADRADALLTKAINALAPDSTKVREGITGAPVWILQDVARATLVAVRAAFRASRRIADAVQAGIEMLRDQPGFNEPDARQWLESVVAEEQPEVEQAPSSPDPASIPPTIEGVQTQVLGDKWTVLGKETTITEQDIQGSTDFAKQMLDEAGIPAELRAGAGSFKALWVWRQTNEDQATLDRKGRALAQRLRDAITAQRGELLGPRLGAILNSVVRNFALADSAMVRMSESVRLLLFNIAQTERSYRGTLLGELSQFRDSLQQIALNVDVYLGRARDEAFGGEVWSGVVERVRDETIRGAVPEVQADIASIPEAQAIPNLPELVEQAANQPIGSIEDVGESLTALINLQPGITPEQAAVISAKVMDAFRLRARILAAKAVAKERKSLTIKELAALRIKKAAWIKIERMVNRGMFDAGALMRDLAKEKGWKPPTDAEVARMKAWALKEQELIKVTAKDIAAAGGNEAQAKIAREEATRPEREQLLRQMEAQWARMSRPTSFNPMRWFNESYRKNNAAFINELISANILTKVGFVTKQIIDVFGQFVIHTNTRAIAQAIEQFSQRAEQTSRGEALSQFHLDLWNSVSKSYADAFGNFDAALRAGRAAFVGRNRVRNVDRLMSGQAALERMSLAADDAFANYKQTGNPVQLAKAATLKWLAFIRLGYRVAQSLDAFAGTLVEKQEIRRQVVSEMRRQGKKDYEIKEQADLIVDISRAEYMQALAQAQAMLSNDGRTVSRGELKEAADRIVKRWQYEKARMYGLPADDFAMANEYLRDTIGWNQRETEGLGGIAGNAVTATGRLMESAGLPLPLGRFGNAIATGINRALHFTPAGYFPNLFGSENNAWFKTELDRTQRKVEATVGTLFGGMALGLAWAGILTVRTMWPKDKEERDLWEREGRKPGTVEINLPDGNFIPLSLSTGPVRLIAPYLAAGGAMHDLTKKRAEAQAKLDAEAARLGVTPGKIAPVSLLDMAGIAANAGYTTLLGGRTSAGLIGSLTDYGTFNVRKAAASQLSPLVPFLPAAQEVSRMAGVQLDSKTASVWDFMLPLPTSGARRTNFLGDPAKTPDDAQRIMQVLTGGTYPGAVNPDAAREAMPYTVLFTSGYRPPSINPGKGFAIGGEMRPMNDDELQRYTQLRGSYLKTALSGLSPDADKATVRAAYREANNRALSEVGVAVPSSSRRLAAQSSGQSRAGSGSRTRSSGAGTSRSSRLGGVRGSRSRLGGRGSRTRFRPSRRPRGLTTRLGRVKKRYGSRLRRV